MPVSERLLTVFLHRRGIATGHKPNFEGYTREPVPGTDVLNVIAIDHSRFEELTKCSQWAGAVDVEAMHAS